ncbi:hypothetical protein E9549_20325 [Blastococcus sp. MG754426]|uniref:hypothetical protein n=1 Tax=unclassified Blastococcus TaxID=2619396 RepID=UPI001EF0C547|nr:MULTISPECIES: hypothetical protein [unclassified Blastococcus]MCF6509720.1 hypothetical protein [Blastococcus sp. MG754426]MCF6514114.1 hypothetical protein [Blastococcus sp. MG754427]MCF6737206.1 hypothetical protein [Blastococcus sp. KM273129]
MSTDNPSPTGPAAGPGEPYPTVVPPVPAAAGPTDGTGTGVLPGGVVPGAGVPGGAAPAPGGQQGSEPGWASRNSGLITAALVAVVVAAIAIAGLILWRGGIDDDNAATEAAVARALAEQGGEVESIQCDGDTCAAIVGGQAYTVLVQTDEDGEQHFGVAAYTGD